MASGPISAKTTITGPTASGAATIQSGSSKLIESQATDASKTATRDLTDNSVTNVQTADPAVAAQAIAAVADVSKQFGTSLKDFLTTTGAQQSAQLQTALGSIGTLAQGSQQQVADNSASADTSGASRFIKPALIALAIVAALIWLVLGKKKS